MATSLIRKNLTFFIFNNASSKNARFCPVSLSISLHFFSTQTPTHLDSNINLTVYDVLVHKHHFPCQFASRVSLELAHVKNPETVDSMLSFFKSSGFSNAQLQKILKHRSRFLCYSLHDKIKPKINSFQDEGFSSRDISTMISSCPRILGMSLNDNIIPSFSVLKGLLGSNTAFIGVVRKTPWLLTSNMEKTVVANVEFLKSIGISMDRIRIIFNSYPNTFSFRPEIIRASAEKSKEMGLNAASKAFVYAIPTIASMSNEAWEIKLQALRDMGFLDTDILSMFRKAPLVFMASIEKMKKITEGLVATGKFNISSIVHYPSSLMFSFEKRYELRMRILRILESRKLIETWPALRTLGGSTDAEFLKGVVIPYVYKLSDVDILKLSAIDKGLKEKLKREK